MPSARCLSYRNADSSVNDKQQTDGTHARRRVHPNRRFSFRKVGHNHIKMNARHSYPSGILLIFHTISPIFHSTTSQGALRAAASAGLLHPFLPRLRPVETDAFRNDGHISILIPI